MNIINYAQQLSTYGDQLKVISKLDDRATEKVSVSAKNATDFSGFLNQAITKLNDSFQTMDEDTVAMMTGDESDLSKVMISMTEAQLSLQTALQVRNKCLDAYNEIKNMQF